MYATAKNREKELKYGITYQHHTANQGVLYMVFQDLTPLTFPSETLYQHPFYTTN